MGKKALLSLIALVVILYPGFMLVQALGSVTPEQAGRAEDAILNYQVSVWVTWFVLTALAIYYKWTERRNSFFYLTYGFVLVSFSVFGYLFQHYFNLFGLDDGFRDNYTLGVLTALEQIGMSAVLTGMLQAAVWWFTRRWHRQ